MVASGTCNGVVINNGTIIYTGIFISASTREIFRVATGATAYINLEYGNGKVVVESGATAYINIKNKDNVTFDIDPAATVHWVNSPEDNIIRVGSEGNDSNDGRNVNSKKLTFTNAITAANAVATAGNRMVVFCEEAMTITTPLTLTNQYVYIDAPNVILDAGGNTAIYVNSASGDFFAKFKSIKNASLSLWTLLILNGSAASLNIVAKNIENSVVTYPLFQGTGANNTISITADYMFGKENYEGNIYIDVKEKVGDVLLNLTTKGSYRVVDFDTTTYTFTKNEGSTVNTYWLPEQIKTLYVGKGGMDSNSGRSYEDRLLTPARAQAIIGADGTKNATNQYKVKFVDGATYSHSFTIDGNNAYTTWDLGSATIDAGASIVVNITNTFLAPRFISFVGENATLKTNNAGVSVVGTNAGATGSVYLEGVKLINNDPAGGGLSARSPIFGTIVEIYGSVAYATLTPINADASFTILQHTGDGAIYLDQAAKGYLKILQKGNGVVTNKADNDFTLEVDGQCNAVVNVQGNSETYLNDVSVTGDYAITKSQTGTTAVVTAENVIGDGGLNVTEGDLIADIKTLNVNTPASHNAINVASGGVLFLNTNTGNGRLTVASGGVAVLSIKDIANFTFNIDPASTVYFANPPAPLLLERWTKLTNSKNIIIHTSITTYNLLVTEGFSMLSNYGALTFSTVRLPNSTSVNEKDHLGTEYHMMVEAGQTFKMEVTPSDVLIVDGAPKTYISSSNVGDNLSVKFMGNRGGSGNQWVVYDRKGAWVFV